MKKADNFDAKKWLVENKVTFQSRLTENKNLGPDDFDTFKWKPQPANPKARLEDLENEDTLSKEDFWKSDIIGNDDSTPLYGSENNGVWTFSWDVGEISGFIEGEDFTLSNLNENAGLASKIAQLPDFNTAENTEKATLVVGKYAVVRYDDREYEDGQDMYVVWDNTRDQDEIGSYDDVPEFESIYPNEVAAWLEQNASRLNEGFQKPEEDSNIEILKKRYRFVPLEDLEMIASKQDPKVWILGSPEFDANAIQLGDYIKFPTDSQPDLVFQADEKSVNAAYDNVEYSKYNRSHLNKLNKK